MSKLSNRASIHDLKIISQPIDQLKVCKQNPRTHTKKQINQVASSIKQFRFNNPILVDKNDNIIAGHCRVEAAKQLGLTEVPTIRIDYLSKEEIRAYIITDNRLAELAGWDNEILTSEFEALMEMDLNFDITITGFEMPEIDYLIQNVEPESDPADDIPILDDSRPLISVEGDLWQCGSHRVLCGDCQSHTTLEYLMGSQLAKLVITDPPYNVKITGHVSGLGRHQHDEFAFASGEMSAAEFIEFLITCLSGLTSFSFDGSLHYIFIDWRHLKEILTAGESVYDKLINLIVWAKTNAGMGSLYRSQHELILVFKKGNVPHINNVQLGKHGRYRTNVWTYPGVNSFGADRDSALAMHPTVKPVQMIADAVLDVTNRGDIVLDGFLGSGTTLMACERTGRFCYGTEISPRYVDTILKRWVNAGGDEPIHMESKLTLSEVTSQRMTEELTIMASTTTSEARYNEQ